MRGAARTRGSHPPTCRTNKKARARRAFLFVASPRGLFVSSFLTPPGSTPAALLSRHAMRGSARTRGSHPLIHGTNKKARARRACLFMASPRGLFVSPVLTPPGSTPPALLSRHALRGSARTRGSHPLLYGTNKKARARRACLFMASPRGRHLIPYLQASSETMTIR